MIKRTDPCTTNSSDFLKQLSYVRKAESKDYKLCWFYMKLLTNDNAKGSVLGRHYQCMRLSCNIFKYNRLLITLKLLTKLVSNRFFNDKKINNQYIRHLKLFGSITFVLFFEFQAAFLRVCWYICTH